MFTATQEEKISELLQQLQHHPIYNELKSLEKLRKFTEFHVFAVFDFMSLLKSLQTKLTVTKIPWTPSPYHGDLVHLINHIVLGEESDLALDGSHLSHFELYLKSMLEIGADIAPIQNYIESDFQADLLPAPVKKFVTYNLDLAQNGKIHQIASSFFYGREKIIPEMFSQIEQTLEKEKIQAPHFIYYLKRHIELDQNEHGPLAKKCLSFLCDNETKRVEAYNEALEAIKYRHQFWDHIQNTL